jgi:terminal uridylyltransferase
MAAASVIFEMALTPAEGQEKEAFRLELENVAQTTIAEYAKSHSMPVDPKKVKLKCYGSLASGFAVQGSDLDLLLMFPKEQEYVGSLATDSRRLLEKALLDAGYGARLLTNTRVPILRVCQKPTSKLLENLRKNRMEWEQEEEMAAGEKEHTVDSLDANRLPDVTDEQLSAAAKAFAELELSPTGIPLPPSPVREHASLEYKGDVGIHCDINFSNYVAIYNTTLLRCYCKCDPRVREMGLFVKTWAKARQINTPYYGTLSSYGYILMVLHYLMNIAKPPVIPNLQHIARDADAWAGKTDIELFEGFDVRFDSDEQKIERAARAGQITENKQNLGALLHEFFWYYSDRQGFRWIDEVISIRTLGGILTKQSKGWTEGKWAGENNRTRLRYLFAIEDPFEIEHNIARTVGHSGVVAIRDEFRRAWDIITKIRLTHRGEWQWRKGDGTVGEDLLEKAEDRGDLLRKDQEYNRKRLQDVRAAFAAKRAREEAANAERVALDGDGGEDGKIAESGMSSASMPNPTQTNEGILSTDRSNSKLIRNSNPQLTPKCTKGRRRKVEVESYSSGDEAGQASPKSSLGGAETLVKSTGENSSLKGGEADTQGLTEVEEVSCQNPDGYNPYIDPQLLNASVPLRAEDVCVRPGSVDDGKPLAWNTNTQAGRWLHWRDQKIRRGNVNPGRYSWGLFNDLHRLFPYDASRPVSEPPRKEQKRYDWLRQKRMAYFTRSIALPRSLPHPESHVTGESLHTPDQRSTVALELARKDSAISGITSPGHDKTTPPSPKRRKSKKKSGRKRPTVQPGPEEVPPMTADKTNSVAATERTPATIQDGIDISLRPRDEDPNIMPIPPGKGFKFDPRQLRDIAIIRQGGNGCARGGEVWNVEVEGGWGGGGSMGAVKTSSALVTAPIELSGVYGDSDEWKYGRGNREGFLGELPRIGASEV